MLDHRPPKATWVAIGTGRVNLAMTAVGGSAVEDTLRETPAADNAPLVARMRALCGVPGRRMAARQTQGVLGVRTVAQA